MKGYRMTYEVEDERTKTDVEETIVFPAAAGPCRKGASSLSVVPSITWRSWRVRASVPPEG